MGDLNFNIKSLEDFYQILRNVQNQEIIELFYEYDDEEFREMVYDAASNIKKILEILADVEDRETPLSEVAIRYMDEIDSVDEILLSLEVEDYVKFKCPACFNEKQIKSQSPPLI
jgi:peptide subunit release factor 1 (eRF1)